MPMSKPSTAFERLLGLSGFAGDPAAVGRELHRYLSERWPGATIALLLVTDLPPGQCRLAGLIGADGSEHLPSRDPFGRRTQLQRFDDALARRCVDPVRPHAFELDPAEQESALAQALGRPEALLALPIPTDGRVDHWLVLGHHDRRYFAEVDPGEALRHAVLPYALMTRPLAMRGLSARAERQRREIASLADVQRVLQPDNPEIRGLDYAIYWQPAETAAGDYYDLMSLSHRLSDFVECGADVWGATIADVSGHGAAAAMEAAQFDAIMRTYQGQEPPGGPAGALTYANRHFFSRRNRQHFMTLFMLASRPDIRGLAYVCAGHPPALHRRGAAVGWLGIGEDAGIPLGVLREHRWQNTLIDFFAGDMLVLYTDGVIEARDRDGVPFGSERLIRAVAEAPPETEATLGAIRDALIEHQGGAIGDDDQTIIVLRQAL
jgi:sigma-B regulation protein RsbU (phosphoserine phosphatase)